jgi:NAD(P)-dependent dehydrogenase (short-subunit alcohol dehydrogenase family)
VNETEKDMSAKWTKEDIGEMNGKTAVVTGANSGIGFDTALALAEAGAHVILACRNPQKGNDAVQRIADAVKDANVEFLALDLASLQSVEEFSQQLKAKLSRLDLLINNAGVMVPPKGETAEGFETQFGTNHLGHFALTARLIDLVLSTEGSRVVTVSSIAHALGKIDFENLNAERGYWAERAYAQSKLANLLFARELQRRLDARGASTTSLAAHPGWTATNLQDNTPMVRLLNPIFGMTPEGGARPTLYAATADDARPGGYYGPRGFLELGGPPAPARVARAARNEVVAQRLWEVSESMTGVTFNV